LLLKGRLTLNAQPNAGNGLAPGLWNRGATFIAFCGAIALGQLAARALNLVFNACINLLLNRTIT
jgi:hypothetical protein